MRLDPGKFVGKSLQQGRYVLRQFLGQGAFAYVYRAEEQFGGVRLRDVAVKWIVEGDVGQMVKEAQALASMPPHANIVTFLTCLPVAPPATGLLLVLEFIDGCPLDQLLSDGRARTQSETCALMEHLLAGLMHAHAHGVVHRDLKPQNTMVQADGLLKLTDFGIARSAQATSTTSENVVKGTPAYMAPEQFGLQHDHRVDLYAAGVMTFELLAGRRPFEGSPAEVMRGHVLQQPEIPTDLPGAWREFLYRALAKNPTERFQSAESMRDSLRQAAQTDASRLTSVGATLIGETVRRSDCVAPGQRFHTPTSTSVSGAPRAASCGAAPSPRPMNGGQLVEAEPETARFHGRLLVNTIPACVQVSVDGKPYGLSPARIEGLAPGGHRVVASAIGCRPVEEEITIEAGSERVIQFTLFQIVCTRCGSTFESETVLGDHQRLCTKPPAHALHTSAPHGTASGARAAAYFTVLGQRPLEELDPERESASKPSRLRPNGRLNFVASLGFLASLAYLYAVTSGALVKEAESLAIRNLQPIASYSPAFPLYRNVVDGSILISITGGSFQMGAEGGEQDEQPVHTVTLQPFLLGKYEVTWRQYRAFASATARSMPRMPRWVDESEPVVNLTWADANAYCLWAGCRLPTEAEWEFAARGTDARLFPWGNEQPGPSLARFCLVELDDSFSTIPVGSLPAGAAACGALDMVGNAAEWCLDWYDSRWYARKTSEACQGPENGHVVRGLPFNASPTGLRASKRKGLCDGCAKLWLGFRVAHGIP
ncbi:MAG: SUMF1/EgtB/PvdO family nonheme iron enzyme [Candidatus Wallbacteria bacterium]|nr:SUMF1/EgtB/PvdO family nonheme iron enzyme [Candidatus Wallbacteria bacterium]